MDWYDQPGVELTGADRDISAAVRWTLAGDAGQRVIAAWHFGWAPAREASGTDWMAPRLAHTLEDPYSAVRWVGWQSLKTLPDVPAFEYDFDGTASHRRAVVGQLVPADSKEPVPLKTTPARRELLIRPDGGIDRKMIEKLIRSRDKRRIEIYE